jgi:hypothetical protein
MRIGRFLAAIAAVALCHAPTGAATPSVAAPLAASRAITPGSWNIAYDDGTSLRLCLQDAEPLIQLAHPGPTCGRLVIQDEANRATVHYSCPGAGWGRTSMLVETPRLVRINSQGIAGKMPFAFDAEARRVGACEGSSVSRPR